MRFLPLLLLLVLGLALVSVHVAYGAWDSQKLHEQAAVAGLKDADLWASDADDQKRYVAALIFLDNHLDNKALQVFQSLEKTNPGSRHARWGIAEVLRRQHNPAAANMLPELARDGFYQAYLSLSYLKFSSQDFQGSLKTVLEALENKKHMDKLNLCRAYLLESGARGMLAHYGGVLAKVMNGTRVMSTIRKAQALYPEFAGVYYGLGSFYLLAPGIAGGDLKKAEVYLKKAVEADPLLVEGHVRLAQVYKRKGDTHGYNEQLKKAQEIDKDNELLKDVESGTCRFICP